MINGLKLNNGKEKIDVSNLLETNKKHLDVIKQHLHMNRAVLFIGAGMSLNAEPKHREVVTKFKTWTHFIEHLAKQLWPDEYKENKDDFYKKIAGNHLMIAQLFKEEFGYEAFYRELCKAVPYKDYLPSEIHKKLLSLPWKDYITTNQDLLVEQTLESKYIHHEIVVDDIDIPLKTARHKVYKIHGSMDRPNSIVFTEEQYRTYEKDHPLLYVKLKALFAEYTVVFVGFSLTDPNFKVIHGWVRDVLEGEYQRKAYAFVSENQIDQYTQRYWEKRNIILLPVERGNFISSMNGYIQALLQKDEIKTDMLDKNSEIIKKLVQDYKEFDQEKIKEIVATLNGLNSDELLEYEISMLQHQIGTWINQVSKLENRDKILLLESIYPFVSANTAIENRSIVDMLIEVAESDQKLHRGKINKYYTDKAEVLFKTGQFEKLENFINDILINISDIECSNNLLFYKIIIRKYQFDLTSVSSLLKQLKVDRNDPKWLNRLGQMYIFIGEKEIAIDHFNLAIQIAIEKKDEWSQYVAYISKVGLLKEYNEREYVYEKIQALKKKFEQVEDYLYKELYGLKDIKTTWKEYREWKSQLNPRGSGTNSRKVQCYYQALECLFFIQTNGLPDNYISSSEYDVIGEIFMENIGVVEAVKWIIFFGHNKVLKSLFSFDYVSKLSEFERNNIFGVIYQILNNISTWIMHPDKERYWINIYSWLYTTFVLSNRLIPTLSDEQIRKLSDIGNEMFWDENLQYIDEHFDIRKQIVKFLNLALFYLQDNENYQRIVVLLAFGQGNRRLLSEMDSDIWGVLPNEYRLTDSAVTSMINSEYPGAIFIYNWLTQERLTSNQINQIFERIYNKYHEHKNSIAEQLLLLSFFYGRLDEEAIRKIIEESIAKFEERFSSRDLSVLYCFGELDEVLENDQIERILTACKNKIVYAEKKREWIIYRKHEIVSGYLNFLYKLASKSKWDIKMFEKELLSYLNDLDKSIHPILTSDLVKPMHALIIDTLLIGLRKNGILQKEDYIYLSGKWLSSLERVSEKETLLVEILFAGVLDSNSDISSESVRAFAILIKDGAEWVVDYIEKIVSWTEFTVEKKNIPYLTNLAFLYSEIIKRLNGRLPEITERVIKTIEILKNSQYSNVRRELREITTDVN